MLWHHHASLSTATVSCAIFMFSLSAVCSWPQFLFNWDMKACTSSWSCHCRYSYWYLSSNTSSILCELQQASKQTQGTCFHHVTKITAWFWWQVTLLAPLWLRILFSGFREETLLRCLLQLIMLLQPVLALGWINFSKLWTLAWPNAHHL